MLSQDPGPLGRVAPQVPPGRVVPVWEVAAGEQGTFQVQGVPREGEGGLGRVRQGDTW